jgi:hypothetical protein
MKNLNVDFLLDIWADLKAKKLAPVAVGMAVALVAMPALLLKGKQDPGAAPLPVVAASHSGGAEVEVADELGDGNSKLDSYAARNPFKGLVTPKSQDAGASGAAGVSGDALGGQSSGKSAADALAALGGGGSGGSGSSLGSTDSGSSGDSGNSGDVTTPGDSGTTPPPVIVKRHHYRYNYELDLKLGRPGREKHYPAVGRLTFLPSNSVPALLFMGVAPDEKSALFFVHPGLSHQGEGVCIPSATNCNFLKLAVGKEHYLSANDYEFHIKLLGINRVKLSEEKKQRVAARKAARAHRSSRTTGEGTAPADGAGAQDEAGAIEMPWLVDGGG